MPTENEIEDIGVVREFDGQVALVEMHPKGGCQSCSMHALCAGGVKPMHHRIETKLDLKVGDRVEVSVTPGMRVFSSFVVFIVPLIFLFAFYIVAKYALLWSEGLSVLSAFIGLFASALVVRLIDRHYGNNVHFTIVGKIEGESGESCVSA